MIKLKAKITFEWEYDADPKHYSIEDIDKMIEMEKKNMMDDPYIVADLCPHLPDIEIVQIHEL